MMAHKLNLQKIPNFEILWSMFFLPQGILLEINNDIWKFSNIKKVNNILQNNP